MEQILTDQVNNKVNKSQITKLSTIMGAGTALNKNEERQNANEQIFLINLLKEITGKNLLTFETSVEHNMEIIHLRISNLSTLHILGAHLDSSPTRKSEVGGQDRRDQCL